MEKKKRACSIKTFVYGVISAYMSLNMPVVGIVFAIIEMVTASVYKKKYGEREGMAVAGGILGGFGLTVSIYQTIASAVAFVIYLIYFVFSIIAEVSLGGPVTL